MYVGPRVEAETELATAETELASALDARTQKADEVLPPRKSYEGG